MIWLIGGFVMLSILVIAMLSKGQQCRKDKRLEAAYREVVSEYDTPAIRSSYWEAFLVEFEKSRNARRAHQEVFPSFVESICWGDDVDPAELFGADEIDQRELCRRLDDTFYSYALNRLLSDPYHSLRVIGKNSIYEGMTLGVHRHGQEDSVVVVMQTPFLYDGTSAGGKFWAIRVRDTLEPEKTEYLALADYSVIPLFEGGLVYNGQNWLEHIAEETEEEEEEEQEEE